LNVFEGVPFIIRPLVKFFIRRMPDQKLRAAISVHPMFQFLQATQLDGVMIDWLKQRRDGANATRIIGLALAYPTKLMWEPKLAATFINLNSAVRQFGDRMMEMFETFRSKIDAHYEKVGVPPPRSVVEGYVPTFATGLWTNVSRRLLTNEWPAERDYVLSSEFEQDVAELRFTQSFADIMIKIFAEAASVAKVRRRFKKGDGGDLLHSLYMPYCRVMRADGGFAEIARAVGAKYGCTVVGKLEELPAVLRAMQAADSKTG
jgi:hypothetical protein